MPRYVDGGRLEFDRTWRWMPADSGQFGSANFFGLRSYREMLAADASPLVMGFAVAAYSIEKAKASGASQENREDDSGGAAPQGNPKKLISGGLGSDFALAGKLEKRTPNVDGTQISLPSNLGVGVTVEARL